jgi:acyl-CoA thioester hydrolase
MPEDIARPSLSLPGRIDRAWFGRAKFPSEASVPLRFADLDVQGHVNNAAVVTLLQEARVVFNRELIRPVNANWRTVVGATTVEYAAELNFPGIAVIRSGIAWLGSSSFTFAQTVSQGDQTAAYAVVTMVSCDDQGAIPLPEALRFALESRCMIG